MLFSYAFMVSGLFVPIIGAFYWKKSTAKGAMAAMIAGGTVTTTLTLLGINLFGFDPNLYGILAALALFILFANHRK
jgi:SSS family solute:Na+ symporter